MIQCQWPVLGIFFYHRWFLVSQVLQGDAVPDKIETLENFSCKDCPLPNIFAIDTTIFDAQFPSFISYVM